MSGRGLTPAHQGYRYQDIFTAFFMMRCLTERYESIAVDKKRFLGDIFDDIHIQHADRYSHYQIKSSRNKAKQFQISQLIIKSSDIRIDLLFDSFLKSDSKKDLYFLCATWLVPSNTDFLIEVPTTKSIQNSSSVNFKLDANAIWPNNGLPLWQPLQNAKYNRQKFIEFCGAFTIELALPISSESLNEPSVLEQDLINLVKSKVGIGSYPNQDRDSIDFSALAISLANLARTQNATHTPKSIEIELSLRTDFGKINQNFPVNFDVFIKREIFDESLISNIKELKHQIVLGSPGAGKSWSLAQLSNKLEDQGICVANHYCYLEPGDEELERRVSTESLFANLLYELSNKIPNLRDKLSSRYSSTFDSLNEAIGISSEYENTVVLIIDGLDHISRVLSESEQLSLTDTDIIGQICNLTLPHNVILILGSQPGKHLDRIKETLGQRICINGVPPWNQFEIQSLLTALEVQSFCHNTFNLTFNNVVETIFLKSEGNPLYATFLAKDNINTRYINTKHDLYDWIAKKPNLNGNVISYYKYLLSNIDDGTLLIANILGLIDFGITIEELKQALPLLSPIIDSSIKHLSPILTEVTGQGGVRIYHESFRRFVIESQPNKTDITLILQPITKWFVDLGFYESAKSYRFLLVLLIRQKETDKVIELVTTNFLSKSVEYGHPEIAIEKNLNIALKVASQTQNWASLARLSELKRSSHTCFEEKLHDQLDYWETFTQVFGAEQTSERLVFDGKPTLPPSLGLAVCTLIDDAGYVAPWGEYLVKDSDEQESQLQASLGSKAHYDENFQHSINRFKGLIATKGKLYGYKRLIKYLVKQRKAVKEDYIHELISALQPYFGAEINRRLVNFFSRRKCINANTIIGIAHLCKAERISDYERADYANLAVNRLNSLSKIKHCFMLGANTIQCESLSKKPNAIPLSIGDYSPEYENILEWYLSLHVNQEYFGEELERIRKGGNWYTQWLEFLLRIAEYRASDLNGSISNVFKVISVNTEPFKGKPRTCDLYRVQALIIESIIDGLKLTQTEYEFEECISHIKIAMDETGTSLDRSDSGPIQTIALLRQLRTISHIKHAQKPILKFCKDIKETTESYGTYFESHAEIGMSLAYLLSSFGHHQDAKSEWMKIAQYLCAYGWRKDVTINEILNSLPAITKSNWQQGKRAFLKSLPLAQALSRHTDGRETKHAINYWFSSLCRSNLKVAMEVLSTTLHNYDGGVSWILDRATNSLLDEYFKDSITPAAYHVLCTTTDFNFRYEGDAKERIFEELEIIRKFHDIDKQLGKKYFESLVKRYFSSTFKYSEEVIPLLKGFAKEHGLTISKKVSAKSQNKKPTTSKSIKGIECIRLKLTPRLHLPLNNELSANKDTNFRRIINFVTDKMNSRGQFCLDAFVNFFGYALYEYSEATSEQQAGEYLTMFVEKANSAYMADYHPIIDLAEGFSRFNKCSLASIAYTLAYVYRRGNSGWGNIGDERSEHYLLSAIENNKELALKVFAKGVGHLISSNSYNHGITEAIICRLSSIGLHDDANIAWWAAYDVIKHRLPLTDDNAYCWLNLSPVKEPRCWSREEGIIALLLAKLDSPYIAIKHQTLLAIKSLVETSDINLVKPLMWYLSESALISSIEVLVAMLLRYDSETYSISHGIKPLLLLYADSPFWIIKNSSRALLKKLGIYAHREFKIDIPKKPLEARYVRQLLSMDKSSKTFLLSSMWNNFAQNYADALNFRLTSSKFNKEQWKVRLHLAYGDRGDCYPGVQVLGWDEELAEITTNEVLNNLAIESQEIHDPDEAIELAISLLPDVEVYIACHELQSNRETYPLPIEVKDASKSRELYYLTSEGKYKGWVRAAYVERQWIFDSNSFSNEAKEKITIHSALAIEPEEFPAPENAPPIYQVDDIRWESNILDDIELPVGLCFGVGEYNTFLGKVEVLVPHASLISALNLRPSNLFTLHDETGQDVLIFRNWQKIHEKSYDTDVIELKGAEVLMHPKLIEKINKITDCKVIQLTRKTRVDVSNPVK
ncbi:ATP-binding protein [Flavobacterium sp. W21_SRS_FM6]|uniref:ATP-binding protein n=1 Tax=Flavobacterium sp. W21_SRS_FM6 TaxID=3240268 RepID=UPI003F8E287D